MRRVPGRPGVRDADGRGARDARACCSARSRRCSASRRRCASSSARARSARGASPQRRPPAARHRRCAPSAMRERPDRRRAACRSTTRPPTGMHRAGRRRTRRPTSSHQSAPQPRHAAAESDARAAAHGAISARRSSPSTLRRPADGWQAPRMTRGRADTLDSASDLGQDDPGLFDTDERGRLT